VPSEKTFVVCADDYANTEEVSRGILNLVDENRLTAVSAISSGSAWREFAAEMLPRRSRVAVGLHLDLTNRPYAGRERQRSLSTLLARSLMRSLDGLGIGAEFERQFDLFEDAMGFAPDHVDGHHHAHVPPQVRNALMRVLCRRYGALPPVRRPLVRVPSDQIQSIVRRGGARGKALFVASLSFGLAGAPRAAGFKTNIGFAGFSNFEPEADLDLEFRNLLKAPGPRHPIVCHPGLSESHSERADPVARRRNAEYAFLSERDEFLIGMFRVDRAPDDPGPAFGAWH
jgi:chitin disaccharide deacetylase